MKFKSCALAVFALWGCNGEGTRQATTCAVYQSFYEYWPVEVRQQFRFARQARSHNTSGQRPVDRFVPGLFVDPYNLHPPEFVEDTSAYFDQLRSDPGVVSDCFPEGGPIFIEASEDQGELLAAPDQELRSIWTFSPVAIAPDGRHALMQAMDYCGIVCGQEYFILFERQGSEWVLVGHRLGMIA
jgi:hypothetical protein